MVTRKRLEDKYEGPLKTRAIREREENQRKSKWPIVCMQIILYNDY